MKTTKNPIISLLLIIAVLLGITACSGDDAHEAESGVVVCLDNTQCSDIAIGKINLCIYDSGGGLYAKYNYTDSHAVALALLPLEAGHYTIAAIANVNLEDNKVSTLTSLHEWVMTEVTHDLDLLSGIADVEVLDNCITRVVIPLCRKAFNLPSLSLQFTLPGTGMADFNPLKVQNRAENAGYMLRCVAELSKAGTEQVVLHKSITPVLQNDGTYKVDLQVSEGVYDIILWTDYVNADAPHSDVFYNTANLKAITINTEPYKANSDAKDASYGNESNVSVVESETTIMMQMQRPLAKYRIIVDSEEVEKYLYMMQLKPSDFPVLDELTVSVKYQGFFPSSFNASQGKPNDAIGGISFSAPLAHYNADNAELELASDWIFVNGSSSFVKATVIVTDSKDVEISRVPGVQIDYRRNELTSIKGDFLTSGAQYGGFSFETEWNGTYDLWF